MNSPSDASSVPHLKNAVGWIFREQRAVWLVLALLLTGDVIYFGLHFSAWMAGAANELMYIDVDRGFAEFFQYIKFVYIIVLVLACALAQRSWQIALWVPVFGFLLLDDSLQLHERFGGILVDSVGLPSVLGLRAQDVGELLFVAAAGVVLLVPLILGYLKGTWVSKPVYVIFAALTAMLGVVGVGMDMVHEVVSLFYTGPDFMSALEDGGEMLVVSLMAAFAIRLNVRGGEAGLPSPVRQDTSAPQAPQDAAPAPGATPRRAASGD
ncbi:MAG TPA: hypothetical protein PKE40_06705 [Arachnia sp.]|nr:hypothetical protein [Arachnia sp.]HMT86024.1 hypothetical protein [Arachnia sp.]